MSDGKCIVPFFCVPDCFINKLIAGTNPLDNNCDRHNTFASIRSNLTSSKLLTRQFIANQTIEANILLGSFNNVSSG